MVAEFRVGVGTVADSGPLGNATCNGSGRRRRPTEFKVISNVLHVQSALSTLTSSHATFTVVVSPTLNCVAYETGNSQSLFVLVKSLCSASGKNHILPLVRPQENPQK